MKKGFVSLIVIAVLLLVSWGIFGGHGKVNNSGLSGNVVSDFSGDQKIIDVGDSFFEFTGGKAIGKSHIGTFEDWEGSVYLEEGSISGIEGVAQVSSVKTDTNAVDKHLQTGDFFDVDNYPEIKFTSTNINYEDSEITGILEIHGISNEIIFPVVFEEGSVSGEFSLDANMFNFKFDALITEIGIKFNFVY